MSLLALSPLACHCSIWFELCSLSLLIRIMSTSLDSGSVVSSEATVTAPTLAQIKDLIQEARPLEPGINNMLHSHSRCWAICTAAGLARPSTGHGVAGPTHCVSYAAHGFSLLFTDAPPLGSSSGTSLSFVSLIPSSSSGGPAGTTQSWLSRTIYLCGSGLPNHCGVNTPFCIRKCWPPVFIQFQPS